jgi:hypothetical protein
MSDKFQLGRLLASQGVMETHEGEDLRPYLARHASGDWGDVSKGDAKLNDWALVDGTRLLSAYTLVNGLKVWVITEADRSSTTVLLPSEY